MKPYIFLSLFLLLGCSTTSNKTYTKAAFAQDMVKLRAVSDAQVDQITEQLEFGDYEGQSYAAILADFEMRMLRVEENLQFIDQMKALKDSLIIDVDWLKGVNLTLERTDERLIGNFELLNLHPRSIEKIVAEISFRNINHTDDNNCHFLVFEIDSEAQATSKERKKITFSGLEGFPTSCPLLSQDYGEAIIQVIEIEFSNGANFSSEDFKTRIAYRYRSIRKSLTPVLLVALWTKNQLWEDVSLSYEEKLIRAKDHIDYREKYEYAIP